MGRLAWLRLRRVGRGAHVLGCGTLKESHSDRRSCRVTGGSLVLLPRPPSAGSRWQVVAAGARKAACPNVMARRHCEDQADKSSS